MSKIRCLLTTLLLASAPAFAQAPTAGAAPAGDRAAEQEARFREADRNGDGYLTFEETEAAHAKRRAERFAKMDGNHDGKLSREEIASAKSQWREERQGRRHERRERMRDKHMAQLEALDTDHDQALSRAELGDSHPRLVENFDLIDANRDGKITREEMRVAREAFRRDRQERQHDAAR